VGIEGLDTKVVNISRCCLSILAIPFFEKDPYLAGIFVKDGSKVYGWLHEIKLRKFCTAEESSIDPIAIGLQNVEGVTQRRLNRITSA
jgi:hypothetical protein